MDATSITFMTIAVVGIFGLLGYCLYIQIKKR